MYDELVKVFRVGHEDVPMGKSYIGDEVNLDPEEAKGRLMRFVRESGADFLVNAPLCDAIVENVHLSDMLMTLCYKMNNLNS